MVSYPGSIKFKIKTYIIKILTFIVFSMPFSFVDTLKINVSTAAAVARSEEGDGIYLGVNAFSAMFTTTERKRSRGVWR